MAGCTDKGRHMVLYGLLSMGRSGHPEADDQSAGSGDKQNLSMILSKVATHGSRASLSLYRLLTAALLHYLQVPCSR